MLAKKLAKKPGKENPVAKRSKASPKRPAQSIADFAAVFSALKDVMAEYSNEFHVAADEPRKYYVVTKSLSWKGGPMFFGAVMRGKAYVSYHLMPLYVCPELVKKISPELKRRMQGKSCFNFREIDPPLFSELGELTKSGLEQYRKKKFF